MKPAKALIVVALFAVPLLAASARLTQDTSFSQREQNFREFVTLRADVKTDRKHIITQMMQFNTDEAAKFWPIFYQYDAELNKIARRPHSAHLGLCEELREFERRPGRRADDPSLRAGSAASMLKKKYFDKMKTAIGATQAAKFHLIENRIQHILDLQISAELPTMQTVSK